MTWMGPKGYPENGNSGRCYFTGLLGMFRLHGESDVLFADGTSGDGFSFRWSPVWGAPAFNGGAGAFHEIWEYTPQALGYRGHWEQDHEGGFDEAFAKLRGLVDRGIPVQVGLHYSLMLPYGAKTSPRLKFQHETMGKTGFGHHVVVAGYDLERGTVTIFEPNDVMPHARYEAPIEVFRDGVGTIDRSAVPTATSRGSITIRLAANGAFTTATVPTSWCGSNRSAIPTGTSPNRSAIRSAAI